MSVSSFLQAIWQILLELAPSLLLGLLIAGLMHAYLPLGLVQRGLSRDDWRSVVRASVLGVPLPLCSCGVIPAALGLRREGASAGATTAFMISTPQTGVDSILVSASFLGWPFAIFKLVAAFATGLLGGLLTNRLAPASEQQPTEPLMDRFAAAAQAGTKRRDALLEALHYAVFDLLASIERWLVVGILVAALVTVMIPTDFFATQSWAGGFAGMLVMLLIALPLYVCTTASVPVAASLIAAGLPAGSALVFLMAGPATNVATIGAVYRTLGRSVMLVYLGTVIAASLGFGLLFDQILDVRLADPMQHHGRISWLGEAAVVVLLGCLAVIEIQRYRHRRQLAAGQSQGATQDDLILDVKGMTCGHCVAAVKQALEAVDRVEQATPDLSSGRVWVRAPGADIDLLRQAVEQAGFQLDGGAQQSDPPG